MALFWASCEFEPDAHSILMFIAVPDAMPAPQLLEPEPGLVQVSFPPESVQPWLVNCAAAPVTLYGYGCLKAALRDDGAPVGSALSSRKE